jgi:hypothetical protein
MTGSFSVRSCNDHEPDFVPEHPPYGMGETFLEYVGDARLRTEISAVPSSGITSSPPKTGATTRAGPIARRTYIAGRGISRTPARCEFLWSP